MIPGWIGVSVNRNKKAYYSNIIVKPAKFASMPGTGKMSFESKFASISQDDIGTVSGFAHRKEGKSSPHPTSIEHAHFRLISPFSLMIDAVLLLL